MANTLAKPRSAWSLVTPMLLFSCFCLLVGDMLFGYDTASFGGILANPVSDPLQLNRMQLNLSVGVHNAVWQCP